MKRHSSLVIPLAILNLLLPALLQAQVDTGWVRRYYAPGSASDQASALAVDGRGNVYVTGASGSSYDYVTIKYDPDGETLWVRRYNGPGNSYDYAHAIAVDGAGNVYVTGESDSSGYDYATVKYDSVGVEQWVARYKGPRYSGDLATAIAVDDAGNVYVTGESDSSGTLADYTTVKYNSSGVEQWVRRYNGPGNSYDYALAIALDDVGNAYVTGRSTGSGTGNDYATVKYSAGGETLWVTRYDGPAHNSDGATAIVLDGSGNVYVTGGTYNGPGTSNDYLTIKYSSAGESLWVRGYNGPANDYDGATAIAVDDTGCVYVTGQSKDSATNYDYATVKYTPVGETSWVRRYSNGSSIQNDYARAIAVDAAGGVYVTGESYYHSMDYATVKYGADGESLWVQRYNGPGNSDDYAVAVAVDDSGGVYVTGRSTGVGTGYDYATVKYVQTQTGVEEVRLSPSADRTRLAIYPSPARAVIRIRGASSGKEATAIRVFDESGKLVCTTATLASQTRDNGEEAISLKGMGPGIYFLRVGTETGKFLVTK